MSSYQNIKFIKYLLILQFFGTNFQTANASNYEVTILVTDLANQPPQTKLNFINPWGLFFIPNGNFSIVNNGSMSTPYHATTNLINFLVTVTINPIGTVRNSSSHDFFIGEPKNKHPARFLFASENGTILGFNSEVDPQNVITAVDRSSYGAIYKGLDIVTNCCRDKLLFATDFHNGKLDVFDTNFHYLSSSSNHNIPSGYAPFNVKNINGLIYVTYAKQLSPANRYDEPGLGNGFVSVFTVVGTYVKNLISQGRLNSPWGMAIAPKTFGNFSGALLIGNWGDGLIHAFDINTGALLGQLIDKNGNPIQIEGLWSLEFDAKGNLCFTAKSNEDPNGVVGIISFIP